METIRLALLLLSPPFLEGTSAAARVQFTSRELFRVPFGKSPDTLGSRVEGDNLIVPREFTLDEVGHFYITDIVQHRIARFSSTGKYQMELRYPPTARQVFAHPDARQNLWLLISDPLRGLYYGVYDVHAKQLRGGLFAQFNQFRLHLDDHSVLHVIASSSKNPAAAVSFLFDENSLLLKKETAGPPPLTHHEVRKKDHLYFADQMPGAKNGEGVTTQITDESHQKVSTIEGAVIYATEQGELYTRAAPCQINVYEADGSLKGSARLTGLPSSCASVRFDSEGNIYQLDGDALGMRLVLYKR
jgi:hypothetical protein